MFAPMHLRLPVPMMRADRWRSQGVRRPG